MIYFSFKNWKKRAEHFEALFIGADLTFKRVVDHGVIWCPKRKYLWALDRMTIEEIFEALDYHDLKKGRL